MKKLKILMLDNEYPPLGGGQGNANYFLNKELSKKDINIDLITASCDKEKQEKSKNLTIYYLNIGKKNKNLHFQTSKELLKYSIKALSLGKKLCKKENYDLIVAWSGVPAGYLAYRLNKKFKVPYIVLLRGADVPFWEARWKYLDKYIFSWLSPRIWRNAKKVIANSNGLKDQAIKVSNDQKISVIPNGVDTEFFKPLKNKKQNNKVIIIGVGRLIPRKGFNYLIEALSQIKDLNFELNLVGDGPEKDNLNNLAKEKGIKNKVKLLGIKDKKQLARLYQESDIFCLPSLNEGMSNTILEAMASGLPIITTNSPGSEELLKNSINGYVTEAKNTEDLSNKLSILIKDNKTRLNLGNNSRKMAEKMSWKSIAIKFQRSFEE